MATKELTENRYLITHEVGPNRLGPRGTRLDHFLKEHYQHRSREKLKKDIDSGTVKLVRSSKAYAPVGRLKPSLQLMPGDEIQILTLRRPERPVCFDYKILFEDEDVFVIEKPANLPVHPSGKYFFNTLLIHLRTEGFKNPLRMNREYFLVHRIDKETSGILVLAKNKETCAHLMNQFAVRSTEKYYFAIVYGITPEHFMVNRPLMRSPDSMIRLKMKVASENEKGLTAETVFKRLENSSQFSLLECRPKTGRQHQIRVHLESAGFPIVGDKLYGIPEAEALRFYDRSILTAEAQAKLLLPRHALHSAEIQLTHPKTGKKMVFHSKLPNDLREFIHTHFNLNSSPLLSDLAKSNVPPTTARGRERLDTTGNENNRVSTTPKPVQA